MELLLAHPIFWSRLLVLFCFTQIAKTEVDNVCPDANEYIDVHNSSHDEDTEDVTEDNFSCFLSQTNKLNCSWSFHTLQEDTQISVNISICNSTTAVRYLSLSEDRVGSDYVILHDYMDLKVILYFNMSLHNKWTVYTYAYDAEMLEVLPPPQNISASVKDGEVLVTWGVPRTEVETNSQCFEYQLDISDQEKPQILTNILFYNQPADPDHTYRVRIRARKMSTCLGNPQWSDWSHIVEVEQPNKLNTLMIILISLGIPMILLAMVLLVRCQRVSNILFPPIPRPPLKYKYFLERNDTFNFFHPALPAKPEEEITEVEDAGQNPGKTF